jgi:hypothetical protein
MLGWKRKERSELSEKAQLSKYYEMDGALRAYANRMAVLGLSCGVLAIASLGLFAYVRLQPPVVIRVDQTGEATVVAGDTVESSPGHKFDPFSGGLFFSVLVFEAFAASD